MYKGTSGRVQRATEASYQADGGDLFGDLCGKWGFGCVILAGICSTLAFFTPYWLENNYDPTFAKMGLWIRCSMGRDEYRTNYYGADLSGECRWILVPYEYPRKNTVKIYVLCKFL